jgi:hypothetical protein
MRYASTVRLPLGLLDVPVTVVQPDDCTALITSGVVVTWDDERSVRVREASGLEYTWPASQVWTEMVTDMSAISPEAVRILLGTL